MRQQTQAATSTRQDNPAALLERIAALEADLHQRDTLMAAMQEALNESAERLREGGELLQGLASSTRALAEIQSVLDPHNLPADTWVSIGEIYFGAQYIAEARQCFERALQQQAGHVNALNNLGVVHFALGEQVAAANCFDAVLAEDPQHAAALDNRAKLPA